MPTTIKVYLETGWTAGILKRWDGLSWDDRSLKLWDGTSWVETSGKE